MAGSQRQKADPPLRVMIEIERGRRTHCRHKLRAVHDSTVLCRAQKKRGWIGTAWEYCIARPLTGRPKKDAQWTMVAEHSELRFIQRNGVFFEDNEGVHTPHPRGSHPGR